MAAEPDNSAAGLRGQLIYELAQDFQLAYETFLTQGACFVPLESNAKAGDPIVVHIAIADVAQCEARGIVTNVERDSAGRLGVEVSFDEAAVKELGDLAEQMWAFAVDVSDTTQFAAQRDPKATDSGTELPAAVPVRGGDTMISQAETRLEAGTLLDGRFQIEGFVASGGMGDVYRATHVFLKRAIALKLLRRAFANDPEMWVRFQREAELVSKLESPHIVRVFDFGRTGDGVPFLAMEYVDGPTLDALLERDGPMSPAKAVSILSAVCEGLDEAHALGIIHRDLKPPNIIIGAKRDGTELPKILDFGIARLADNLLKTGSVTQSGLVVGTPAYLAPEQALAAPLDVRTDVYALGCVAYELIAGRPPFRSENLQKVIAMQLTEKPPPIEQWQPAMKNFRPLADVIYRALAKDPAERFQSVKDLKHALNTALTGPAAGAPVETDLWAGASTPSTILAAPPPADDFFSMDGGGPAVSGQPAAVTRAATKASPQLQALEALGVTLPPAKVKALTAAHEALGTELEGAHAFQAELLRAPAGSEPHVLASKALIEAAIDWGGSLESVDEDGFVFVFPPTRPTSATLALLAARERIDAIGDGLGDQGPRLRAVLACGRLTGAPLAGEPLKRVRAIIGRVPAGLIVATRGVAAFLDEGIERRDGSAVDPDVLEIVDRRALSPIAPTILGRDVLRASLDKRLTGLAQGVVAPVVVVGPSGSGRSTIAQEFAIKARQQSMVVAVASAIDATRTTPFSALADLLCQLCGVPFEQRVALLPDALTKLRVAPSEREAVLVLALGKHTPTPFTSRQAVHSLRAVLAAGSLGRRAVLIFDGVEQMDAASIEVFHELGSRPGTGELIVGFTDAETARDRLGALPTLDMPALTSTEVKQWLAKERGLSANDALVDALHRSSRGLPAPLHDWMAWLADTGALAVQTDDLPPFDDRELATARLQAEGHRTVRVLAVMALAGEPVDSGLLKRVLPDVPPSVFQRLLAARLVRQAGGRRWAPASSRYATAALLIDDPGRAALAMRLAQALNEQAKAQNTRPDVARLAMLLVQGRDAVRAIQAWKAAAEDALHRRMPRELMQALAGWADALRLLEGHPSANEAAKGRVELLARAVSNALLINDAGLARTLLDAANETAQRYQLGAPEHFLAAARVLRSEARRTRAADALARAEELAHGTAAHALCLAEKGEVRETEGDLRAAAEAYAQALQMADDTSGLARWHGEIDFRARLEARLAGVFLAGKDVTQARHWLSQALTRWKAAEAPAAEARVLANLGTLCVQSKALDEAAKHFEQAAASAAKSGDLLFQAKQLLHLTRVLHRQKAGPRVKQMAELTRALSMQVGWDDGRIAAEGLLRS